MTQLHTHAGTLPDAQPADGRPDDSPGIAQQVQQGIALARRLDADDDAQSLGQAANALALADTSGDPTLQAAAAECLALCQLHQGVYDAALENVYRAIGLWRKLGDVAGEAGSRVLHAQVLLELGQADEALVEVSAGLQLVEKAADARHRANGNMVAGFVSRSLGRSGDARAFFEQALAQAEKGGDRWMVGRALCNLGNIHSDVAAMRRREGRLDFSKDLPQALALYDRSLELFRELGDARLEGNTLRNIALTLSDMGNHAAAFEILGAQLLQTRERGNRLSEEMALRLMGKLHLERGELASAVARLHEALALADALQRVECQWLSHEMLSQAHEKLGDATLALRHYKRFHALQSQVISERNERRGRAFALQYQTELVKAEAEAQRLRASALEHNNRELQNQARKLSEATYEDPLTGLYNRRRLDAAMQAELRLRDAAHPYSIAMVDIDFFKRVNDTFSHQTGDQVLREVAAVLRRSCRQGDMAIRYGGEEFALVFIEASAEQASRVCERIRKAVQAHGWSSIHPDLSVTVSIGIADNRDAAEPGVILALADKRLYAAKHGGRNQVVSVGE